MRSLLRLLVYIPLGLLILYFALANRGSVKISLDPFPGGEASALSFEAPLFLVVLTAVAIGVIAGGASSWLTHAPLRRTARQARAEASKARSEVEQLRQQTLANLPSAGVGKDLRRKRGD